MLDEENQKRIWGARSFIYQMWKVADNLYESKRKKDIMLAGVLEGLGYTITDCIDGKLAWDNHDAIVAAIEDVIKRNYK